MHVDVNTHSSWFSVPVFKCINHRVISFRDLYNATVEGKTIYVTDPKLSGIDFSVFEQ